MGTQNILKPVCVGVRIRKPTNKGEKSSFLDSSTVASEQNRDWEAGNFSYQNNCYHCTQ